MHTQFIVAAVVSTFAAATSAAPLQAPYALSAANADFLLQLEETSATPGQTGVAARNAADLLGPHIEAEKRIVLPLLELTGTVAGGRTPTDPQVSARLESLNAELPGLHDEQTDVVGALVELFAAADAEGRPEIARLAQRMIWREMLDAEVLYPAAVLAGSTAQARMTD